jgi:hypothetical protein
MKCLNIKYTGRNVWNAKYIGRHVNFPLHFGNPFILGKDGSRDQVCNAHLEWILGNNYTDVEPKRRDWIIRHLHELKGFDLLCFCAPKRCHGENYIYVLELIEEGFELK